jgi:hypothetical protein
VEQKLKSLLKTVNDLDLGQKVIERWRRADADRQVFLQRQRVYLKQFDEFLVSDTSGPFQGSSQLHLPIIFNVVKTYAARMYQALFSLDPAFTAKPRRPDGVEKLDVVTDFVNYALKEWCNNYQGSEEQMELFVWHWITTGSGVIKNYWEKQETTYVDIENTPAGFKEVDGVQVPAFKEKQVKKTKQVFNGPQLRTINLEDFVLIGGDNVDTCDAVMERTYFTESELRSLAEQKIFDLDAVEEVVKAGRDYRVADLKIDRDINAGISPTKEYNELPRFEVVEAYLHEDIDESGITSSIVVWVHVKSMKILRAAYLHQMRKDGMRPYSIAHFYKRPNQPHGVGLVEILYPIAVEIDAMHNQRIDYGLISNMPFFFYRASSSTNAAALELRPGMGIPVDNPATDVFFPNLSNRTVFGEREEAALLGIIERLTGLNDMAYGSMSSQGAARTATGAAALLREVSANLDIHLRKLARSWGRTVKQVYHLLRENVEPGLVYRLTGDMNSMHFNYIKESLDDLCYEFDFEITANTAQSNPTIRLQNAQALVNLTSNPLYFQMGVVTPEGTYNALKNQLTAMGIKDISNYLRMPQMVEDKSPAEVIALVLNNIPVQIRPGQNHEKIITALEFILNNNQLLAQYSPQQAQALAGHLQERVKFLEAERQQAAQQANIQQQQINAQMAQGVGNET